MKSLIGSVLDALKNDFPDNHSDIARSINAAPKSDDYALPCVFVHYLDCPETSPNETMQVVTQRRRVRFAALIVARNYNPVSGADELQDARESVVKNILGLEPEGFEPIEYVGGSIIPEAYTGVQVCWRDIFQTYQYMRSKS